MPLTGVVKTDTITVSTAVSTLNTGLGNVRAGAARITVDSNAIRWTTDSAVNLSNDGHVATVNTASGVIELVGRSEVANFRAVRSGGSDASVTYSTGTEYVP